MFCCFCKKTFRSAESFESVELQIWISESISSWSDHWTAVRCLMPCIRKKGLRCSLLIKRQKAITRFILQCICVFRCLINTCWSAAATREGHELFMQETGVHAFILKFCFQLLHLFRGRKHTFTWCLAPAVRAGAGREGGRELASCWGGGGTNSEEEPDCCMGSSGEILSCFRIDAFLFSQYIYF